MAERIEMAGSPSSVVPHRLRTLRWFLRCRRGAAAVEFALTGLAFFGFIFAIMNLGLLGLNLGALQHATQQAARQAAVQAAANPTACPNTDAITGYFNNYAAPVIPANAATLTYSKYSSGSVSSYTPVNKNPWVDNSATPTGTYIALTATYTWKPIGWAKLATIPLSISTVAFAMGSPGC